MSSVPRGLPASDAAAGGQPLILITRQRPTSADTTRQAKWLPARRWHGRQSAILRHRAGGCWKSAVAGESCYEGRPMLVGKFVASRSTETFARIATDGFGVPVEVSPRGDGHRSAGAVGRDSVLAAVLEHVYDPMALLARVHAGLRRGGVVYIDVPNECSFYSRMGNLYLRRTGKDWATNLSPTFPPFHVVGFCPASLKWALRKAGFLPVQFDLYKMESYFTPRGGGVTARMEAAGLRTSLALGQLLGMGAGITCWARRV